MANPAGTTSSHARIDRMARHVDDDGHPEIPPCDVLLVGPEGLALRAAVEQLLPADHAADAIDGAESILEAVLMSGGGEAGARSNEIPLILAGISQELEQIEPAVRSMRKVYPRSRIVLLSEPGDEVLCRKAKNWGASDYLILPADHAGLRRLFVPEAAATAASELAQELAADAGEITPPAPTPNSSLAEKVPTEKTSLSTAPFQAAAPHDLSIPALPLVVQAVLFNDLLLGRSDFVDRVIATLQTYVKWNGTLKFIPSDAPNPEHPHPSASVGLAQQPPFGTLIVELAAGATPQPCLPASLSQAAHWLASLLAIAKRYEQLRSLAITDELSGAYNRRYFTKFMNGLLERARSNRFRVTLLLFDIDDFKKYNDTFGHASGDAIIRELIKLLRSCTRPHDLVARLGGDEFACVYWDNEAPRTPNSEHPRDAVAATERFRIAVQKHQWSAACNIQGEVSISGGLATFPWDADSLETLMTRADEALLRAKAAGKNVFLLHGESCDKDGGGPVRPEFSPKE